MQSRSLYKMARNLRSFDRVLTQAGNALKREVVANSSGRILHKRSGTLAASWDMEVKARNRGWDLSVLSDVVYARIHEFGGWTGAGHATYIPSRKYVSKAYEAVKEKITAMINTYMRKLAS